MEILQETKKLAKQMKNMGKYKPIMDETIAKGIARIKVKPKIMDAELITNINNPKKDSLTAVIRISGMVGVPKDIENTLYRLRLRRKYACVVIDSKNNSIQGLLEKVKYYVAYGEISKETYDKLVKARGEKINNKLKPFFRLHPPRKGIKSKLQYPKGVLGNNKKDINKLIERML